MRGIVEDVDITACLAILSNSGTQECAETFKVESACLEEGWR